MDSGLTHRRSFSGNSRSGSPKTIRPLLISNIRQNWIGEFSFGLHKQRNNVIPDTGLDTPISPIAFSVSLGPDNTVAPVVQSGVQGLTRTGDVDWAYAPGGTLQRNYLQKQLGLYQTQSRDRWEAAARLQKLTF